MLPMKARYAVKALVDLARAGPGAAVPASEIARRQGIPRKFLEAILVELRNAGVLASRRGTHGGYALLRAPNEIGLGDVLRTLSGPLAPVPCLSKTAYRRCPECPDEAGCAVRALLADVHAAALQILDGTSLADLAAKVGPPAGPASTDRGDRGG